MHVREFIGACIHSDSVAILMRHIDLALSLFSSIHDNFVNASEECHARPCWSGRQWKAELAGSICGYSPVAIVISGNYSMHNFKEDLQKMYKRSGVK